MTSHEKSWQASVSKSPEVHSLALRACIE